MGHFRLDDDVRVLKCKNCFGRGEGAKAKCLASAVEKPCNEDHPVCVQITSADEFELLCASQMEFNKHKASCDYDNSCVVVQV